MTSKNSFWANVVENNRRRIWLWVMSGLLWFFYYPVGMAIILNRSKINLTFNYAYFSQKQIQQYLNNNVVNLIGTNEVTMVLISVFSIICAIQGFSYLYSKKKVDFYHSVPVAKSKRAAVIFSNSILIFFVPYIVNLLFALIVSGVNGVILNFSQIIGIIIAVFINLLLFLGIYALAAIAVMMTGNVIITLLATAVFLFYEVIAVWLYRSYQACFLKYFSDYSREYSISFSPCYLYSEINKSLYYLNRENIFSPLTDLLPSVLHLVLLVAAFLLIAYICYRKRPSEAAGKAMAFPKTKSIIKLLLTVPCTLCIGLILLDMVGKGPDGIYNMPIVIFGLVAAVILSNSMIEVIYEQDIRAALKKKYQIFVSGGCVAVIFCIFYFDLTGFAKWIPDENKLESAAVIIKEIIYEQNYWDENGDYLPSGIHYLKDMEFTDVQTIRELSEKKMDDEEYGSIECEVAYRMKNGKTKWRKFWVDPSEEEILNKIMGNSEYKKTAYQIYDEKAFEAIFTDSSYDIIYDSGIGVENLPPDDLYTIRELLIKDMDNANYSTYKNEYACGSIKFFLLENMYSGAKYQYEIYPSYINTISYLKEKGIYRDSVPAPEDIERITVTRYHDTEYYSNTFYTSTAAASETITKDFTDEKQIMELSKALYPANFTQCLKPDIAERYSVTIHLKSGKEDSAYYRGSKSYVLIGERIPDWLEKETSFE